MRLDQVDRLLAEAYARRNDDADPGARRRALLERIETLRASGDSATWAPSRRAQIDHLERHLRSQLDVGSGVQRGRAPRVE